MILSLCLYCALAISLISVLIIISCSTTYTMDRRGRLATNVDVAIFTNTVYGYCVCPVYTTAVTRHHLVTIIAQLQCCLKHFQIFVKVDFPKHFVHIYTHMHARTHTVVFSNSCSPKCFIVHLLGFHKISIM